MTNQEAFNKVWEHFVTNKQPLSGNGNTCYYRGPNGTKCAVGVLIPDVLYSSKIENQTVLVVKYLSGCSSEWKRLIQGPLSGLDIEFLNLMQRTHDIAVKDSRNIKEGLEHVAKQYNLVVPVEETVLVK